MSPCATATGDDIGCSTCSSTSSSGAAATGDTTRTHANTPRSVHTQFTPPNSHVSGARRGVVEMDAAHKPWLCARVSEENATHCTPFTWQKEAHVRIGANPVCVGCARSGIEQDCVQGLVRPPVLERGIIAECRGVYFGWLAAPTDGSDSDSVVSVGSQPPCKLYVHQIVCSDNHHSPCCQQSMHQGEFYSVGSSGQNG
jgi:hypothetical protein